VTPIRDVDDPRLAAFRDVRHRCQNRESTSFIAEGRLVVERLIDSDYDVESLLVEEGTGAELACRVPDHVPVYSLPAEAIRAVVGYDFHRGVLACGRRRLPQPLAAFANRSPAARGLAVAPVCVTEAANVGSMLRSAAAFGIENVLLGPGTHDPLARRVLRVSMAAVLKQQFYDLADPAEDLRELSHRHGMRTVAATLDKDATPVDAFVPDNRDAILVLGNEASGLPPEVQGVATDRVRIPMRLGTDSLNVAVASAILMYELTRPLP
jgi:tRNA G18 (ribose-2'-O)-methylase SpoU